MASPPLRTANPYGQSAPGITWAPLYYEVKCLIFCVSCSKALWPVRPWDQRILMANSPLGPPEPPYTMRLNVWYFVSVAAKPYGQSATGTTWAPLYYEVKCVVFCVSCSKALWPVRPWDHLSPPILWRSWAICKRDKMCNIKVFFCDLYNYFEIWHFYQIIHICWSSRHMWTISTAVQTPKMQHYAIKSILICEIGRYRQSLLFQCNFFLCSYFNEAYHCSLS